MTSTEIHIWRIPLDMPLAQDEVLSPDELDRASRFHAELDRIRYYNAHTALRRILAQYTDCEPRDLDFQFNPYGKPALANVPNIEFNLSHSHSFALVAISGSTIGIDLELVRTGMDVVPLSNRFFAPAEAALVRASPDRFFEFWTRKEAFIKAIGMGVSFPLQGFDTCSDRVNIHAPTDPTNWYVQSFHPLPNYIAAIVTPHSHISLNQFDWPQPQKYT